MIDLRAIIRDLIREETPKPEPKEYLSTEEAAAFASVRPATIRRWIRTGQIVGYRAGRLIRVRRVDLERHMSPAIVPDTRESPEEMAARALSVETVP